MISVEGQETVSLHFFQFVRENAAIESEVIGHRFPIHRYVEAGTVGALGLGSQIVHDAFPGTFDRQRFDFVVFLYILV